MQAMAKPTIAFGIVCMLGSLFLMMMSDPHYPMPLAVCGAGFFIGGAVLTSR